MAEKAKKAPRVLPVKLGDFTLLNPEKVERAKAALGDKATDAEILAEYDKYGGAIRTKEGRAISTGVFFDFKLKKPIEKPKIEFDDEYVLVRKKVKKGAKEEGERVVLRGPAPKASSKKNKEEDKEEEDN